MFKRWDKVRVKGIFGTRWGASRKGEVGMIMDILADDKTAAVKFSDGSVEYGDMYGIELIPVGW